MTPEQFRQFLEATSARQEDHDILIEIKAYAKSNNENFIKHCEEDAASLSVIHKKIESAHKRIDWLTISGILALIFLGFSMWVKSKGG